MQTFKEIEEDSKCIIDLEKVIENQKILISSLTQKNESQQ